MKDLLCNSLKRVCVLCFNSKDNIHMHMSLSVCTMLTYVDVCEWDYDNFSKTNNHLEKLTRKAVTCPFHPPLYSSRTIAFSISACNPLFATTTPNTRLQYLLVNHLRVFCFGGVWAMVVANSLGQHHLSSSQIVSLLTPCNIKQCTCICMSCLNNFRQYFSNL